MSRSTLLFAQQGIKAVQLNEDCITVHYVDGSGPLHINSDDKMYEFHRKQFTALEEQNLASLNEEPASTEEA